MWLRSDPWDRTAAWAEHDSGPPPEPITVEPWMRWTTGLTVAPVPRALLTVEAASTGLTLAPLATTGLSLQPLATTGLSLDEESP